MYGVFELLEICFRCIYWLTTCLIIVPISYVIWATVIYPLYFLWPQLYWKLYLPIFRWTSAHYGYFSYTGGFKVVEFGENPTLYRDRGCLILPNHQAVLDNTVLLGTFEFRNTANTSLWLIDSRPLVKWNPIGLGWQTHGHFFTNEGSRHRSRIVNSLRNHLEQVYLKCKYKWIVMFPEGGFLQFNRQKSQHYAAMNNHPHLENVLLPRSTAALTVLRSCRELGVTIGKKSLVKYILDVTIAYPNGESPSFIELLCGTWPHRQVHIYYRVYKVDTIPIDTERDFRQWLFDRWVEKEAILKEFYNTGKFPDQQPQGIFVNHSPIKILLVELFFWVSFYTQMFVTYALLNRLFL